MAQGPRVGEQLSFFEGGLYSLRDPWCGRSPRALTRVALGLILKPRAEKSVSDFVDPEQYDLWPSGQKDGPLYEGAVPLLPLPWEGKNG